MKILCVEDDQDTCEVLTVMLGVEGFAVETVEDGPQALERARQGVYALYILDNRLREIPGVELCRQIRTFDTQTPIFFFSANAYEKDKEEGLAASAQAYLTKPNGLDELVPTVKTLLSNPPGSQG